MASDDIKQAWKVPESMSGRLPWYLAFVKLVKGKEKVFTPSTQIARGINVDPSQVVKDLSLANISGKARVGYDIDTLVNILKDLLGFTSQYKALLFGVESLGASLLYDTGLSQYGLEVVAGFGIREDLDRSTINGTPVFHMDGFPAGQKEYGATIGVVTVSVKKAQEVTDRIIEGRIKAFWNFILFHIRVSEHIVVQNISMYAHLAVIFNRLNSMNH